MSGGRPDLDLERLIGDFQRSGLRELHVRNGGLEIYLSQDADAPGLTAIATAAVPTHGSRAPSPVADAPADAGPGKAPPVDLPPDATIVRAPYLGTFYRSPKPGQPPYVEVGQRVDEDADLCLVEVMKLFTAVRAGTAGAIHAILAQDGEMVAAGQPLFAIVPGA